MSEQFPKLRNDLILRVINGERVERTPVWIMRQAGRYLPEFKEIRKRHDFFEIVRTPDLACEITLQPIDRYNFDAAIIFSDILIVCQAMGMRVDMVEGKGPVFDAPLNSPIDFNRIQFGVDVRTSMDYLLKAITLTRINLDGRCPLIGFTGAPWTLMCYMTDTSKSSGNKDYNSSRKWLYKYPSESYRLLDEISIIVGSLLIEQARAGAQLLMLFESHAGVLNKHLFTDFELPMLYKIASHIKEEGVEVPLMYFAKGGHYILDELLETPFDVIGLDWSIDPRTIRSTDKTLMGNLDPAALYGTKGSLESAVSRVLDSFKGRRHIFNLGHGIYPDVDPSAVQSLVEQIRKGS